MNHVTFGKSDRIDSSVLFFPSQSLPLKLNALRTSVFTELVSYWFNFHLCFGLANTTTSSNLINIILPWDFRGDFPRAPKVASFSRGFWVEVLVEFLDDFQLFACVRRHHPHTRLGGLGRWGGRSQTVSQNMKENKFEKNCMNEMAKPART